VIVMQSFRVSRRWIGRRSALRREQRNVPCEAPTSFDRAQRGGVASGAATLLVAATGFLAYAVYHDYGPTAGHHGVTLHSISGSVGIPDSDAKADAEPAVALEAEPVVAPADDRPLTVVVPAGATTPVHRPAVPAPAADTGACPAPVAAIGLCAAERR
jgi:hypothetical protein